jgi:branched-chain amino acid transport system permease protein
MSRILGAAGLAFLVLLPLLGAASYLLHMAITILLWAFVYTAWSIVGKFGLVSLGHGAFLGIGAYTTALLWNFYGLTPWLGIPVAMLLAVAVSLVIGYPCSRLKVVGHYFALVTLALAEVARLGIVAARDVTGGSLGMTPRAEASVYALQFDRTTFYFVALAAWLFGLYIWRAVDRGIGSKALEAIAEDETAAAAIGINVTREKLRVTAISAALTALGGALLAQYLLYVNPETVSGAGISLQIVFAAIAGGMYALLGPTVGAILTLTLTEALRILFGTNFVGAANTIYGVLLIVFIIFMPRGIVGALETRWRRIPAAAPRNNRSIEAPQNSR